MYAYDDSGRLGSATYSNGLASQYNYDAVGQNTRIEHRNAGGVLYSEATTWSANGNPTSSDISGLTSPDLPSGSTAYAHNDADQLTSSTFGTPVHDKNGNLTVQPEFGGASAITYDLNNRPTAITGSSMNAAIKYLGDGKLAELTDDKGKRGVLVDPTAVGNRILAELDANGGMQVGYVVGPRGLLSQNTATGAYSYFHNLQGSAVLVLDATGAVRNSYRYAPFGQKLASSVEQINNGFAFLGSFTVPTIGHFIVTGYRLYDSRLGRFTGPDPAASTYPSLAPYIYANQSPLSLLDPSGLSAIPVNGSSSGTAGSTPASLLNPTNIPSSSNSSGLPIEASDVAGILIQVGKKLAPAGYELIPDGAGAWKIVKRDPFGKLDDVAQVVDLLTFAADLGVDIWSGNATLGSIAKATGKEAVCVTVDYYTAGLGCLDFKLSYAAGNALFAPGKPLSPIIQGGTVGGVYVPGLGDFTKDVILDFPQNTKTVWNATKSAGSATGGWISKTWSSIW